MTHDARRTRIARRWTAGPLALLLVLAFAGVAHAATISPNVFNDPTGAACPGTCSLRAAIAAAGSGDVVQLSAGTYTLSQGQLFVDSPMTIQGPNLAATTIDGSGNSTTGNPGRILRIDSAGTNVLVSGITFTGGVDGNDEKLAGCSPCETLSLNGGGAIFNNGGTVTVQHSAFTDNGVNTPLGGAIAQASSGNLTLDDVSFTGDGAAIGGAVYEHGGTVSADTVTFENNGNGAFGGGAFEVGGGSATLTNTTVVGNGWASGRGGGVVNAGGNLTLVNDTFKDNIRGGLETASGASTSAKNTIVASGFSDFVDFGCVSPNQGTGEGFQTGTAVTSDAGHNIDQDGTCGMTDPTSQVSVDPKLATIADNGGTLRTAALVFGSPAIDAGTNSGCPATDARDVARDATCDIGAFEFVPGSTPPTATTAMSPTNVTSFDATLSGTANPKGEPGGYHFEWGTSSSALDNTTPEIGLGEVSTDQPASADIGGLSPGTTYFYRVVADNQTGAVPGTTEPFTTPPQPPQIFNVNVASTSPHGATITFTIDPQGADTTYHVVYGQTASYGSHTVDVDVGATPGPQDKTVTLTGLVAGHGYHFDIVATNSAAPPSGVDSGDATFITSSPPPPSPTPTPTPTPSPTPSPTPTPTPNPGRPKLSRLKVVKGRTIRVHVNQAAKVAVALVRCQTKLSHGIAKTVCKTKTLRGHTSNAGTLAISVPKSLPAGRYKATARATSGARRSQPLSKTLTLRRSGG